MITAATFDFSNKKTRNISSEEIRAECEKGIFCWIKANPEDLEEIGGILRDQGVSVTAINEVTKGGKQEGRYNVYPKCLHFSFTEARLENELIVTSYIDITVTEKCFITVDYSSARLIELMDSTYEEDFLMFSQSPGFLLYELGDHLLEVYHLALRTISSETEKIQEGLFGRVDDAIFLHVSSITSDLLQLRRIVLASRDVMHELGTRKSPFVSDSTQPFLLRMAGRLESLGEDISEERDALNEMLHLYMGMVSHRTNKVVNRLTAISTIFLPLAFLCGVYGMNFEFMPELGWKYSYPIFWSVAITIAGCIILVMKKKKWI